ncbi:tyrosine-type recombinase/integrase [Halobaculum sp. MBLA0147]|uniref:tyrosine-type recombinase/integrase n=1 Tax=Halobaculum sp. MBLA0147 TaxID=3079934 RepID=UPI0035261610
MPDASEGDGTRLETAVAARLRSLDAGAYRANSEHVLEEFVSFLRSRRDVTTLEEIDVLDVRRYAQYLRERVHDDADDLSASSAAGPYFTVVRAFLGWCVDDERLDANPARPNRAREPLPTDRGDHDRQFWSREAREQLLAFVDDRAHEALEGDVDVDRTTAFRDRALVTALALTGARGAELFATPRDEDRNGLRWRDVDLAGGTAVVFGKTREEQPIPLLDRVVTVLDRYRRVLEPPTDEWPVFPTEHAPSLARAAREGLAERGWADERIETALADATASEVLRDHEVPPPAISTNGARSLMRRLCEAAEVFIDGEYLKPHGGRRGLGSEVYAEDAELAQELLRHESIETTHQAYREERVAETRERVQDVLDGE